MCASNIEFGEMIFYIMLTNFSRLVFHDEELVYMSLTYFRFFLSY